jgi:hypothetical protein
MQSVRRLLANDLDRSQAVTEETHSHRRTASWKHHRQGRAAPRRPRTSGSLSLPPGLSLPCFNRPHSRSKMAVLTSNPGLERAGLEQKSSRRRQKHRCLDSRRVCRRCQRLCLRHQPVRLKRQRVCLKSKPTCAKCKNGRKTKNYTECADRAQRRRRFSLARHLPRRPMPAQSGVAAAALPPHSKRMANFRLSQGRILK